MSLFASTSTRQINIALAVLRGIVGLTFIMHGGQKLFVYGFAGVSGAFAQMGMPMPGLLGPFVAFVEFFGGTALLFGLLTRLASTGLGITMVVAILAVHLKAGFFNPNGYEFPLSLLASLVALTVAGAGAWSLDALVRNRISRSSPSEAPSADRQTLRAA